MHGDLFHIYKPIQFKLCPSHLCLSFSFSLRIVVVGFGVLFNKKNSMGGLDALCPIDCLVDGYKTS